MQKNPKVISMRFRSGSFTNIESHCKMQALAGMNINWNFQQLNLELCYFIIHSKNDLHFQANKCLKILFFVADHNPACTEERGIILYYHFKD